MGRLKIFQFFLICIWLEGKKIEIYGVKNSLYEFTFIPYCIIFFYINIL